MSVRAPTRRSFLLFAGSASVSGIAVAESLQDADKGHPAAEILERMAQVYAGCGTYRDSGVVTTSFFREGAPRREQVLPFSTAFVRPSQFRFEFSSRPGVRYIAASNGNATHTWWDLQPGVKDSESLNLALAEAAGISGEAAHTVPALLMPDVISGMSLITLGELKRLDNAKLEGEIECFRVEGSASIDLDPEERERARQQVLRMSGRDLGVITSGPRCLWIDR